MHIVTMNKPLLLIIDMQQAIVEQKPFAYSEVEENIKTLLNYYRENDLPRIFIQHNGHLGTEFEPGTDGWKIVNNLSPEKD